MDTINTPIHRCCVLFDVSRSMNKKMYRWPFRNSPRYCDHALEMFRTLRTCSPQTPYEIHVSYEGDDNEFLPVSLEVVMRKYNDTKRQRNKSNLYQRINNLSLSLQDGDDRSLLLIYSDGKDNRSSKELREKYKKIAPELARCGYKVISFYFGAHGLDLPGAYHYRGDGNDFPPDDPDTMQRRTRGILNDVLGGNQVPVTPNNICNPPPPYHRAVTGPSTQHAQRRTTQRVASATGNNIHTLNDYRNEEAIHQCQYQLVYA